MFFMIKLKVYTDERLFFVSIFRSRAVAQAFSSTPKEKTSVDCSKEDQPYADSDASSHSLCFLLGDDGGLESSLCFSEKSNHTDDLYSHPQNKPQDYFERIPSRSPPTAPIVELAQQIKKARRADPKISLRISMTRFKRNQTQRKKKLATKLAASKESGRRD